jgi:hypothetical protein
MTFRRSFFTSFTAIALALATYGCGDGESGNIKTPLDCSDPGTGDQTWKLTALMLPQDGEVVGFDLDDHNTQDGDTEGCGIPDLEGGADNMLGGLLSLVGSLAGEMDIDVLLDEAITDGSIDITAVVTGYDGPGDDVALISLFVNGEPVAAVQNVCVGVLPNGDIDAEISSLPIAIPDVDINGTPLSLTLDLSNVRLVITNPSVNNPASAVLGGGVLWDDGAGNGLGPAVEDLVADLIGDFDIGPLVANFLDLYHPNCNSISLGVTAEFTRQ